MSIARRLGPFFALLLLSVGIPFPAAASSADDYATAISRALTLVQFAERGDTPSLQQAIVTLKTGTDSTQPEILDDLEQRPPHLVDAEQRLLSLKAALSARIDAPDAGRADRELHRILALPRYGSLNRQPSLVWQAISWILDQVGQLLRRLGIRGGDLLNLTALGLLVAAIVVVALLAWLASAFRRRDRPEPAARGAAIERKLPADFFGEADRLAAAGDYPGALRALAGGVAVALSGERAWDQSPLTVRELFSRAESPEALRALLLPFEAAAYARRDPDAATYARAAQAAAPFRRRAA